MKNTKAVLVLAAAVALAVLGYFALGWTSTASKSTIGAILAESGFAEFKPPSQHALPGTLVVVSASQPLALGVICRPQQSLGLDPGTIPQSPSASSTLTAALDRKLSVDSTFLAGIKASVGLGDVESIEIRLTNVRLLELSDDDVIAGISNRSQACRDALELRLGAGSAVTMIKSALQADATYVATTRLDANGKIAAQVPNALAASLNSTVTGTDGSTVELKGENLIWGIRDDQVLARLGTSQATTATEGETRTLIPPATVITTLDLDEAASLWRPGATRLVLPGGAVLRSDHDG